MKKYFLNSLLFMSAFLLLTCSGCKEKNDNIKVGIILPLSGGSSAIGEPKKRAFDIALEEFNGEDGLQLEFLFEDSKGTARDGITAFQKLLRDKSVKYYYIDLTPIVNSCVPLVNENSVITFAGSAEPEITDQSNYLFRLFAGGDQEIKLMVDDMKQDGIENIFVLHTNELYGNNAYRYLEKEFSAQGGKISGHEEYPINNTDFRSILVKAKAANAQKIILLGYGNEYVSLLKQAVEMDIKPSDFVCNLGGSNKSVIELPDNLLEGMTFVGPRFSYLMMNERLEPEMTKFVQNYQAKYNELPDFRAAYSYDVVKILVSIWKEHKDDINNVDKMSAYLKDIKDFRGASGIISFLPNGDTHTDLIVAKYVDGNIVLK